MDTVSLLAQIEQLSAKNDNYEDALIKCKNKFEFYEHHHLVKGDTEKAAKNAEMVEIIRNTLIGK